MEKSISLLTNCQCTINYAAPRTISAKLEESSKNRGRGDMKVEALRSKTGKIFNKSENALCHRKSFTLRASKYA